jgi:mannosylglycerate hydrolase
MARTEITATIVSHTHWDREWYRPFEGFRARLIDTIDVVLDQLVADPGWSFLLDGQTVVVEDYLAIRPQRRGELEAACRAGRLAIGPWYVQPDSLLPSGEAHIRNLLEGRRVGEEIGPVSRVAYTPDSFGHPAQFPQLFSGFGLGPFVYWRGNGSELDRLAPVWRWVAPDGTAILACHLGEGYFAAAYLGTDIGAATARMEKLVGKLGGSNVLLMNGLDHAPPDATTGAVAAALAERTGWDVRRGLLETFVEGVDGRDAPSYTGELLGGRVANLLPGVWSARTYLKRRNRSAQTALEGWAEPWAAFGASSGLADERPALRLAWRALLANQAHDSICGCSTDRTHEQMLPRYDTADALAAETTGRVLERLAGLGDRRVKWDGGVDLAVFNPSPRPATGLVRFALDGHPVFMIGNAGDEIHSLVMASLVYQGLTTDGAPARVIPSTDPGRVRMMPEQVPWDVEFVAVDVPAFGWKRFRLSDGPPAPDEIDDAHRIELDGIAVEAAGDGTLSVTSEGRTFSGLLGIEDIGDRGDTYDFDPVDGPGAELTTTSVVRRRHVTGVQELEIIRHYNVPSRLAEDRKARAAETVTLTLTTVARLVPGTGRVDLGVTVDNTADDHRVRLLFPTGASEGRAATTFDVTPRTAQLPDDRGWMHVAIGTFPQQGWVQAGGLTVGAPDLPEAQLTADGSIAITLIRAVGWLSGMDLKTRPVPAGPGMPTPGAQCRGLFETQLQLWPGPFDAQAARQAEVGLRAVVAGPEPLIPVGTSLLELSPAALVLQAVKPAEQGDGIVIRVLNPTDQPIDATLRFRTPVKGCRSVRLDEQPVDEALAVEGQTVTFAVRAHGLRTVALEF